MRNSLGICLLKWAVIRRNFLDVSCSFTIKPGAEPALPVISFPRTMTAAYANGAPKKIAARCLRDKSSERASGYQVPRSIGHERANEWVTSALIIHGQGSFAALNTATPASPPWRRLRAGQESDLAESQNTSLHSSRDFWMREFSLARHRASWFSTKYFFFFAQGRELFLRFICRETMSRKNEREIFKDSVLTWSV